MPTVDIERTPPATAAPRAAANPPRGRLAQFLGRHTAFDHSRAVLPWFWFARDRGPMARLHRLALGLDHEGRAVEPPNMCLGALAYLIASCRQMALALRRHGAFARAAHGVGYGRQLADLVRFTWRLNQPAHDYYLQKMWLRADRATWRYYLQQREHVALVKWLGHRLPLREFDDKLNLHHHLQAAGIPTIEILRVARAGEWLPGYAMAAGEGVLRQSLVAKPTDGTMFDGVEIWRFAPAVGTYTRERREGRPGRPDLALEDQTLGVEAVLARTLELSRKRTYIVQPKITNHPALRPFAPRGVANFRVVTAAQGGRIRVAAAILRLGFDTLRWAPTTYLATIDLATGVLGKATGRNAELGHGDTHIETGCRVAGARVEQWPEIRDLALRAHGVFAWMPTIGWDVVCSPDGPLIMEANAFWGADIVQMAAPLLGEVGYAEAFWEAHDRPVPAAAALS